MTPDPELEPGSRREEIVPFDQMRRRIAEHMVRSKATSAHVYMAVETDFENVDRARRANAETWKAKEDFSLTYLPFVLRALAAVVPRYPYVNARVDGESVVLVEDVHVGVAVDLEFQGLVVPVVQDVPAKSLRELARNVVDLAARARDRELRPADVSGGTFTVTNAGPFGTAFTLPIINQPQVAILSTDGVRRRPWVVESPDGAESVEVHPVGMLTLSWDHRAFDGAYAASFLATLRETLETHDWQRELA